MSHLWNEKPDGDPEALIAALKREIDWTLLFENLRRPPEHGIQMLDGMEALAEEGRKARERLRMAERAERLRPGIA